MATASNDSASEAGSFFNEDDFAEYLFFLRDCKFIYEEENNKEMGVIPNQLEPECDEDPASLMSVEVEDPQEGGMSLSRFLLPCHESIDRYFICIVRTHNNNTGQYT